uniref:Uncharacterized protein n=1 Tax=Anguilla anguilla TaxID=7936 RepID=A0A0E9XLM2_ANGAN
MADGDVTKMLKQAFIIAHPYASQQIRDEAGLGNKPRPKKIFLSKDRTMNIYRAAFLELIRKYHAMGIIGDEDRNELIQYVQHDMYLDSESELYQQIVRIVRQFGGHNH